jgi:hypothetical protein
MNGDAVGEMDSAAGERLLQRRGRAGEEFLVAGNFYIQGLQVAAKTEDFFDRAEPQNGQSHAFSRGIFQAINLSLLRKELGQN